MTKIKGLPRDYDSINHIELRSDLENGNIEGETLVPTGKISESPETWAIDRYYDDDEDSGNSYLYESKQEYLDDVKILNTNDWKENHLIK